MKERVLAIIQNNNTANTKSIAHRLGITTKAVYNICIALEKEGKIVKYGYRVKDGWEDITVSNHHFNSLTWQIL